MRCCAGNNNNNFIIGLTNVSPNVSRPILWNYAVCGQYPGVVPDGATVTVHCYDNLQQFRYVIVQLPGIQPMRLCELQVFVKSTWMIFKSNARCIIFTCKFHTIVILSVRLSISLYHCCVHTLLEGLNILQNSVTTHRCEVTLKPRANWVTGQLADATGDFACLAFVLLIIYLWSPYVIGQTIIFSSCFFLLLSSSSFFFFFSSPNLSGRRLDVYHTLAHGVALVRI